MHQRKVWRYQQQEWAIYVCDDCGSLVSGEGTKSGVLCVGFLLLQEQTSQKAKISKVKLQVRGIDLPYISDGQIADLQLATHLFK